MSFIRKFLADESGATAVEYSLIAALMAAALLTLVGLLDGGLTTAFDNINESLDTNAAP
jgi:pilus assembly protein Flp/PilA